MNRFRMILSAAVVVAFLVLSSSVSFAQTSNGTIAGTMTDKTGGAVPKATVAASSQEVGEKRSTVTDSVGTYRIESLLPGKYLVIVTAPGFAVLKISNVEVKASFTTTVNGVLEVGSVAATVTVESSTEQELQTQSGELSHNISTAEINNLPVISLNPIALALTEPGVQSVASRDDFTNGFSFSVNGTRPRANNFLIDGQDNNDNAINGQAFQATNLEAISEVTILTNSYGAEFGRGGGSVTNVISKGGTNRWHGSLYDIHRNSALAAIPAEDKLTGVTSNPVDIENTFGYAIGGPIKRDKLFFFQSTQWDRERQTANGSTLRLPTPAGVTTLQSLGANANVAFLLASIGGLRGDPTRVPRLIPLGNGRPVVETGLVQRSGVSEPSNDRQEYSRVDWNASSSDVVTARYIRDDFSLTPDFFNFPGSLPPYDSQQGGPSYTSGVNWVHTFSARAVNEFRFSFTSINFTFGPTAGTAANPLFSSPRVTISGSGLPSLGFPSNLPQFRSHKNWQYQEAFSYTIGTHTIKGGADISHLQVVDEIPFNSRGTLGINGGGLDTSRPECNQPNPPADCTFRSLANFVDNFTGASGSAAKVFGNPVLQPFVTTYAPYVQDTWRIRPNFTLDIGMRYEYWGTPENILPFPAIDTSQGIGLIGSTFPSTYAHPQKGDKNNFAPRVGFAYTPRFWQKLLGQDKTVIRAGYGIFYDGLFTNILDNTGATTPNAVGGTITGGPGRGTAGASQLIPAITPTLNPRAGVNTIAANLANPLTHQWNLDVQREIPGRFLITAAYVGTRGERLFVNQEFNPGILFGPRVNPALGGITVRTNGGDSIYHAAQLKVDHKMAHGYLVRGSYTFSRLIDDGSEVFTTSGLSSFSQDPFNQAGDRGLSAFHRKHRLALTYIWEIPYVHSSDNFGLSILKALTRDWQTAGTISFTTGAPETVTVGNDVLGDGRSGNDRPNLADPTKPKTDISRYVVPPNGTLGNVGRNDVLTPGRQDWNLAVQRIFKVPVKYPEAQQLMLRAEFFNAFNHPNLGYNPLGSSPTLNMQDPDFGNFAITRFGGRQIRLWLRYSF